MIHEIYLLTGKKIHRFPMYSKIFFPYGPDCESARMLLFLVLLDN